MSGDSFALALAELREALAEDQPIAPTDTDLLDMAQLCADELCRRLPRYALNLGDLPEDAEDQVAARESIFNIILSKRGDV